MLPYFTISQLRVGLTNAPQWPTTSAPFLNPKPILYEDEFDPRTMFRRITRTEMYQARKVPYPYTAIEVSQGKFEPEADLSLVTTFLTSDSIARNYSPFNTQGFAYAKDVRDNSVIRLEYLSRDFQVPNHLDGAPTVGALHWFDAKYQLKSITWYRSKPDRDRSKKFNVWQKKEAITVPPSKEISLTNWEIQDEKLESHWTINIAPKG